MTMSKVLLGAAIVGTIVSGGIALDSAAAPEASAAACWGQITQSKGKNYGGCGQAKHFNRIGSSPNLKWGSLANPGSWSNQPLCYANVTQYGMVRW